MIDWRTLAAREREIRSDLASAEELARLAGVRERAGIAPGFDRVRAEGSAAGSRSRLVALESERARLLGRLVTLTAQGGAQVRAALAQENPAALDPPPPATLPSVGLGCLAARSVSLSAAPIVLSAPRDGAAAPKHSQPSLALLSRTRVRRGAGLRGTNAK